MENEYVLEMVNISKSFPGVKALDNVNLKVKRAVVHAIVGENGAGKSTLMKILNGVFPADEGKIILNNENVKIENQKKALKLGISMIYQELNPVLEMTIAENIYLGNEPKSKVKGFVNFRELYERANSALKKLGLKYNPATKMKYLSVSDMQMVEIAKAISHNSSVIVMDEPTSAISEKEVKQLFGLIKMLNSKGITIIYISHRLEELAQIADFITVLRDGNSIDTKPMKELTRENIIKMMVGREVSNLFPKCKVDIGAPVLKVEGLTRGKAFRDISFKVRRGEIFGISGLMGAGRTEVARAIFGLDKTDEGRIELEGSTINISSPKDAIKYGITMVSEDRKRYGLILCRSILENITLPFLKKYAQKILINKAKEKEDVLEQFNLLSIKAPGIMTIVNSLSGGNQQKVVLAKWMIEKPKVLILDEPTRGIDVGAKYEIYKLMCQFAESGIAVIFISSELPEILGMCDTIAVMSQGVLKGTFRREELDSEKIMSLSAGV